MGNKVVLMLLLCLFCICGMGFAEQQEDIGAAIKNVVVKNLEACEKEDTAAMMATVHSQSPSYLATKQEMAPIFENYDLKYKLTYFKYIGKDGDYAVARAKQATEKVSGGYFQNNEIDMIQIFKQENGEWKFWNQAILEVKYL
jgi:hypothetical protein